MAVSHTHTHKIVWMLIAASAKPEHLGVTKAKWEHLGVTKAKREHLGVTGEHLPRTETIG